MLVKVMKIESRSRRSSNKRVRALREIIFIHEAASNMLVLGSKDVFSCTYGFLAAVLQIDRIERIYHIGRGQNDYKCYLNH